MDDKNQPTAEPAPPDENKIIAERRAKLAKLREDGVAYPNDFTRSELAPKLDEKWGEVEAAELEKQQVASSLAGRLMLKRVMGTASFGVLQDHTGRLQIYQAPLPRGMGSPA